MSDIESSQIYEKLNAKFDCQYPQRDETFYSQYLEAKGIEMKQSRFIYYENLQKQFQLLQVENQKLQILLESNNKEIKSLRQSQFNTNFNSFNQKELEIKNSQIDDLQKQLVEIEKVKIEKQAEESAQIEYLEEKVYSLKNENEELKKVNNSLRKELGEVKLQKENEQTNHHSQLYEEIFKLKETVRELERENTGQREEYEQILQRLVQEQKESYEKLSENERQQVKQNKILIDIQYLIELEEVKQKFDRDLQLQNEEKEQLMNQLNENEQIKQQIEGIYYKEIEAARDWCQKQCYEIEISIKRDYEKQLQEKNNLIFCYKEQLTKQMNSQLENSRYRSKSQQSNSILKPYIESQYTAFFKSPFQSYEKENATDLSLLQGSNKSYDNKKKNSFHQKYQNLTTNQKRNNPQQKKQFGK